MEDGEEEDGYYVMEEGEEEEGEEEGEEQEIDLKGFVDFVKTNLKKEIEIDHKETDSKSLKVVSQKKAILEKLSSIDK